MSVESKKPLLSVVIVNYNTREMTLRCLKELYADLGDMEAEVFVVDNGSHDGSLTAIREGFSVVKVIEVGFNAGFGAANNLALAHATGEYILLLNTDAFLKAGAIAALVDYLQTHPRIAVVGPRLLNADGSLQRSCYKFPSPIRATFEATLLTAALPTNAIFGDFRTWDHDADREVDFVIGAAMLVRRQAIDEVGVFDESFFMYAEETDWCLRFKKAGWAVAFIPTAIVVHYNGGSGKNRPNRVFNEFHRGQERLLRKHYGWIGLIWYRLMIVVGSIIRVSVFSIAALLRPERRERYLLTVRKWLRILTWTVGKQGLSLSDSV